MYRIGSFAFERGMEQGVSNSPFVRSYEARGDPPLGGGGREGNNRLGSERYDALGSGKLNAITRNEG